MADALGRGACVAIGFALILPALADPLPVKSVTLAGTRFPVILATQAGHPYDAHAIEKDVHNLWATGRFDDIRVESNGAGIEFRVHEAPQLRLHEIRIEPNSYGLHPKIPEGAPIDPLRAHEIALEAQKRLSAEGYLHAHVDPALVPVSPEKVDLRLTVHAGDPVDLKDVEFQGSPGLRVKELRGALRAARIRRVFPPIPGIWAGWRLFPPYNEQALDADLARLRSLYLSRGYFDANVRLGGVKIIERTAKANILVQSGPQYRNAPTADLCSCLMSQRRDAERQGILDFSAALDIRRLDAAPGAPPLAILTAHVDEGPAYHVGRIEFTGNHRYSDSAVRRNFLLDEGAPLDRMLLRKSLARINRAAWFEPVGEQAVQIRQDHATGLADLTLHLTERQHRAWSISGPVGPLSVAGPLQASIRSRLPAWGPGLFELSTYSASFSLVAFAHPLLPVLSVASKSPVLPVLAIQRPFTPGEGWTSGFALAPQLGWPRTALGYGMTQIEQRLLPRVAGDRALEEELPVTVERPQGEMVLACEPPKPRLANLRRAASLCIRLVGALLAL